MTKKEAAMWLRLLAAEIALTLDLDDEDCPTWPESLDKIAAALVPANEETDDA